MAIKFQYNKTSMQQLKKQLKVRENALPTLQSKEAALRVEVKKAKDLMNRFKAELEEKEKREADVAKLWNEFPDILRIEEVVLGSKKIAGVLMPVLTEVRWGLNNISLFNAPAWVLQGVDILKKSVELSLEVLIAERKMQILEYARKKTTQKVNLYEKVQIPGYKEALLKIKRFLEDVENLSKSSQKILKQRMAAAEAEAQA